MQRKLVSGSKEAMHRKRSLTTAPFKKKRKPRKSCRSSLMLKSEEKRRSRANLPPDIAKAKAELREEITAMDLGDRLEMARASGVPLSLIERLVGTGKINKVNLRKLEKLVVL